MGHPDDYRKFGFVIMPGRVLEGVPQAAFFALSFDGQAPPGTVAFHEAFKSHGRRVKGAGLELSSERVFRTP